MTFIMIEYIQIFCLSFFVFLSLFIFFVKSDFFINGFECASIKNLFFISFSSILFYFLLTPDSSKAEPYFIPSLAIFGSFIICSIFVFSYIGYKKHLSIKE